MKFGPVPLADALGAVLAHSAELPDGRLRKGKILDQADLDRLAAAGWRDVIAAQLGPDDIGENTAADRLADAMIARPLGGVRKSQAATGRVNLLAAAAGVVDFQPGVIAQINAVNPMITIATVPQFHRCAAGEMIATIKIIAYGVPQADVATAAAHGTAAFGIKTRQYETATLIETQTGIMPSLKGRNAVQTRLARLGMSLTGRVVVPHRTDALTDAIRDAPGDVILILTASATSDPADVGPSALIASGGTMTRFGMPVDPGNLLFLGCLPRTQPPNPQQTDLRDKPVIGLPGCARSLALNGADWVLDRVICGVRIGFDDIAAMGVGGLLKEIPTRPRPRDIDPAP